jgi:hypothetical protein
MDLATRMFKTKAEADQLEDDFFEAIQKIIPKADWSTMSLDSYDGSFEIYGFSPFDAEFTDDQLGQIWELGFSRFWLHPGDSRNFQNPNERYFYRKNAEKDT